MLLITKVTCLNNQNAFQCIRLVEIKFPALLQKTAESYFTTLAHLGCKSRKHQLEIYSIYAINTKTSQFRR